MTQQWNEKWNMTHVINLDDWQKSIKNLEEQTFIETVLESHSSLNSMANLRMKWRVSKKRLAVPYNSWNVKHGANKGIPLSIYEKSLPTNLNSPI